MKIVLFGAVGLVVGLSVGTGVSALKEKKVLTAELIAQQDSIAAAHADSVAAAEEEASPETVSTELDHGTEGVAEDPGYIEQTISDPEEESHEPTEAEETGTEGDGEASQVSDPQEMPPVEEVAEGASADSLTALPESEAETDSIPGAQDTLTTTPETTAVTIPGVTTPAPAGPVDEEGPMRLAKIFGAMDPQEAAKVLENLEDPEVEAILRHVSDRKVAAILANFDPSRAAGLSRVVMGGGAGGTG
jgi:hypothetical protein